MSSASRIGILLAVALLVTACGKGGGAPPAAIPEPALEGAETPVADAIREATEVLRRATGSAQAWGDLGMLLDTHGFDTDAVTCYRQAAVLEPAEARWPYLAGSALAEQDPLAAVDALERAIALDAGSALYRQACADALVGAGRADEAEARYLEALEIDPTWRRARLGLGELAVQRGDLDAALEQLQAAAELDHCDREVHATLARVYRRLGDEPAAQREALLVEAYPDRAAVLDPARSAVDQAAVSADARTRRALRLIDAGRDADAEREIRHALAIRPDNVRNQLNLGGLLVRQGRHGEALAVLGETLAAAPDDPEVHNNLAVALTESGHLSRARGHLQQAIALDPSHDEAYFNLGRLELRAGQRDEASAAFEHAVEINPVNVFAHNELGRLLASEGRHDEAARHWQAAIDYGCNNPEATVNLAMLHARRGEFGPALELLRASLRRHGDHEALAAATATILATCPEARYRNGPEAVALASRLVARNGPEHVPSLNLLAAALAEAGDFPAAMATAQRAVQSAERLGDAALANLARARLSLYQSGQPYHQGR
jgi:tetratricopeptide (TPR) repeat protein